MCGSSFRYSRLRVFMIKSDKIRKDLFVLPKFKIFLKKKHNIPN